MELKSFPYEFKNGVTLLEGERLNKFPDEWTDSRILENRRYFVMDNALIFAIVSKLSEEISQVDKEN